MLTDRPQGFATSPQGAVRRGRRLTVLAMGALLGAGLLGAGGCYFEGGPGWSADRFTYRSTSWQPKTVTLIDTRTGERLWSVDVPVNQQLVVAFLENRGDEGGIMPDMMQWRVFTDPTQKFGDLDNRMPVPDKYSRLLVFTLRPAPEMPGAILSNRGPAEAEEVLLPLDEPIMDNGELEPIEIEPMDPAEAPEPAPDDEAPIDLDDPM